MNKDKTTNSVNESGFQRTGRRLKIKLSNANRANIEGAKAAILRRETRLARTGHIYRGGNVAHGDGPNSPRTPPKNRDRKIITNSFNHGLDEGRYERIRAADIKKHGYTELPGRSDPKRAAVFNANTRKIARDLRLAGIVPGSANARPENRSDVLIHSARMSAEKRAAGKPSPRTPPKNRDRKIITNSFNHGLEEGHKRNHRVTQSKSAPSEVVDRADSAMFRRQEAQDIGVRNTRERLRRIRRNLTNSFNHGLEEAKRPTTPKRPIKSSKSILGAAARGAISGMTTPKPAGTSRTKHVLGQAVRNMARHVMDKFL